MFMKNATSAIYLILSLTATGAMAKPVEENSSSLTVDDLKNFRLNPGVLNQRLDQALMENPNSIALNFLRGLIYDATSSIGSEGRQLAKVGYITALRGDPTYWPANYQLGLLAMEDGDALSAERYFIAAAVYADDEPQLFYALARAAYCSGDLTTARLALDRAKALKEPDRNEEFLTAALVLAASGDQPEARRWFERLGYTAGSPSSRYLQERMARVAQQQPAGSPPSPTGATASSGANVTTASERKMATVDVVIIRRQEGQAKTSGINLMDALTLQFGSTLINSERDRFTDQLSGRTTSDAVATMQNVNLAIPTVAYSLNVANAMGNNSSIEARQTLLVYNGVTSKVFSGGTLTYSASGQMSAQSFTKEVGLSLSVTPKFVSKDTVSLNIVTGMESFLNDEAAGTFNESVQTQKSSSEITVDMKFGETVFVSGGHFENFESRKSSTPLISGVPLIGKLFSQRMSKYAKDDLLVILSMRRDTGHEELRSQEQFELVDRLALSLWKKLGIDIDSISERLSVEEHRPFYDMDNAGRSFNPVYIRRAGVSEILNNI